MSRSAVPALTTEQMRAVGRAMVEDLHIELIQIMENAGRNLTELRVDATDQDRYADRSSSPAGPGRTTASAGEPGSPVAVNGSRSGSIGISLSITSNATAAGRSVCHATVPGRWHAKRLPQAGLGAPTVDQQQDSGPTGALVSRLARKPRWGLAAVWVQTPLSWTRSSRAIARR